MARLRYVFNLLNMPLKGELKAGPFLLTPIQEGQEDLRKQTSMDTEPVIGVAGVLPISENLEDRAWWTFIDQQGLRQVELLLSFAERRFVEVHAPEVQAFVGDEWVTWSVRQHMPMIGNPHGVAWHCGHAHLQDYIDRCLPLLTDSHIGEESGLRLALKMYRSNLRNDFVELQYLKTWMVLEVLYSSGTAENIVDKNRFPRVRRAVRSTLDRLYAEGRIREEERNRVELKLPELNRTATFDRAMALLERVFVDYPAQDVTEEEMRSFIHIRNSITHQVVSILPDIGETEDPLHVEHMRLMSLLERVILAMFGQDANLMNFSWRHWFDAR